MSKTLARSTSSFVGKCATVLMGMGLSWVTVTVPEVNSLAAKLCGLASAHNAVPVEEESSRHSTEGESAIRIPHTPSELGSPSMVPAIAYSTPEMADQLDSRFQQPATTPDQPETTPDRANTAQQSPAEVQDGTSEVRMREISAELRRLGASYLLVEKLTNGHRRSGEQFRVRCDLAGADATVKCAFEATCATPVAALEEVLRTVRQATVGVSNSAGEVVASSI